MNPYAEDHDSVYDDHDSLYGEHGCVRDDAPGSRNLLTHDTGASPRSPHPSAPGLSPAGACALNPRSGTAP